MRVGSVVLSLLVLGSIADAERPRWQSDGSVRVGTQVFASTAAYVKSDVFRARGGRCGSEPTVTTTELALVAPSDCAMNQTLINADYEDNRTLVIQVIFHVIKRTDGLGDIPPALLESQIDILNEDFMALSGTPGAAGHNSKIKFVLARWTPDGQPTPGYQVITNDTWFEDPGSGAQNYPMKDALNWDPTRYLNIYTNDANGLLGYATFPAQSAGTPRDGVVALWESVGRNSPIGPPYDLGRTLTHEIGHYLGLYHTFQGCGTVSAPYTSGDLIGDTPRERSPNYECTPSESSCNGGAGIMNPIENYMNYTDDVCMTKFTVEQGNRMRCSIMNYRTVNTEPKAAFTAAVAQQTVTFTNASTDVETPTGLYYNWDFGDGQTSNEASPTHTYATHGMYQVKLEVVDPGSGANVATQSVMIEMPPMPDAGMDGDGEESGGGCCDAQTNASSMLLALPVLLVLRRRRRR